jgi:hypothetical protein
MRNVKLFFSVAILTALVAPSVYGQAEDHTGTVEDVVVGETGEEFVAPSLEWEVDEDTARDMCKLLYAKTYGKSTKIPWDEIQARVYPVYSYDGKRKYYLGLVYYGEGEMPSHEVMMESIKEGYEAVKKRTELEMTGKKVPEDLKIKCGYKNGFDENHNQNYWSVTIPASKSLGTSKGESLSIHDAFSGYFDAPDWVEMKSGISGGEVVGILYDAGGTWIKVKGGSELYFVSTLGSGWVNSESEMAEKSANATSRLQPLDWVLRMRDYWEQNLEEIERYNSSEPIIYPEEDEGGSEGRGIKWEYR